MRYVQGGFLLSVILCASSQVWAQGGTYDPASLTRLPPVQAQGYPAVYTAPEAAQYAPAYPQQYAPAYAQPCVQPYTQAYAQPYAPAYVQPAYGQQYMPSYSQQIAPPQPYTPAYATPRAQPYQPASGYPAGGGGYYQRPTTPGYAQVTPRPSMMPYTQPQQRGYPAPVNRPYGNQIPPTGQPTPAGPAPLQPTPMPVQPYAGGGSCASCGGGYPSTGCGGGPCESCDMGCCGPLHCATWYVTANGLIMTRQHPAGIWTTQETNPFDRIRIGNTSMASPDWQGGAELTAGRWFEGGTWGLEASFWALDSMDSRAVFSVPGGHVSSMLDLAGVTFAGVPAGDLFNNAEQHIVTRQDSFYNLEVSVLGGSQGGCGPVDVSWSIGPRWFHFDESISFATLAAGGTWGGVGTDEAYFHDKVVNDLVGLQLGADVNYHFLGTWRVFFTPKVGVYGNHIEQNFALYRGDGVWNSLPLGLYPAKSSTNTVAFLTQMDLGVDWQFHPNWTVFAGYRVLLGTNMCLADNEIPHALGDVPAAADINSNGSLVLHGAFAGVSLSF